MSLRILVAGLTMMLTATAVSAQTGVSGQIGGDVLGMHSLGPGSKSPITGARPEACAYCHAPHSGLNVGLWNQRLTTQKYTTYSSTTEQNTGTQPTLGGPSNQCLSCHDGTVAVGDTVTYGQIATQGAMNAADVFGKNLQSSHPFSLAMPLKDNVHLVASLRRSGKTADPTQAVKLINRNVECISCHDPHVQAKDQVSQNFLVKDGSNGQLCLACHDPNRQMTGQVNPLANWTNSIHAQSTSQISSDANLGSYTTVAAAACISCHTPHNSGGAQLLRGQNEQDCIACHNGAHVSKATYMNVFAEYAKKGHPLTSRGNPHDAAEPTLLDNNRHATCVDCHNAHGSQQVGATFPPPPQIRASQTNVAGINASDGTSVLAPAVNQYENCLRCHGRSLGKQKLPLVYGYYPLRAVSDSDTLNIIPQFASAATSSHPVMHARSSSFLQPSLRSNMLNLDGTTAGRAMGTQILCTDCHNSDDNREFGGTGANGPHGSKWDHILERRYEFSQAATPGGQVTNLFPNPDLTVNGPYALCAKCHDLSIVAGSQSWSGHASHITKDGFSCSVCHTAHGIGTSNGSITGERLVNFDVNVVGQNGGAISYNQASKTCNLACHDPASGNIYVHSGSTVTAVPEAMRLRPVARK